MTPDRLPRVAVIGNGIIGHGVAEVFAAAGMAVRLVGRSAASLSAAVGRIRDSRAEFVANGLVAQADADAAIARIETGTSLDALGDVDLVIEAVPEDMDLKLALFEKLDAVCPPAAVLASSSGHPASELHDRVRRKERVIAAHFWYPPQLIPLVEVCGSPQTARPVIDWTCDILRRAGKEPVIIDREIAGFIGNRIQFAALREAWSLWAAGIASAEAIDAVVRNSIGRRLGVTGPIESADLGGLDTMYHFARFLQPTLDRTPEPPARVGQLVEAGHRGLQNGRGVYDWSERHGQRGRALLAARRAELFRWLKADRGAGAR
jgi:3-hydroxybutyryl-CoA dehydrogenase